LEKDALGRSGSEKILVVLAVMNGSLVTALGKHSLFNSICSSSLTSKNEKEFNAV
jgi:hypothetical protein